MHAGRHYSLREVAFWTRRETLLFLGLSLIPASATALGFEIPTIPWPPIALLGTAVAFVTGFKSNAAYGRLWEARQVWGAIINASRAWALQVRDFVTPGDGAAQRRLLLRHLAWLTALRHQLREPRAWETMQLPHNVEFQRWVFAVPEQKEKLQGDLAAFLAGEELTPLLTRKNRANSVLGLQSSELAALAAKGQLSELKHIELQRMVTLLQEQQGKCERLKNFPYPRQFATLNRLFVWLFIALLPFGVISDFKKLGGNAYWLAVPMTLMVAWVFHTMDKIGEASENPFEGGPNDVPITAMSRTIEIDLKEQLGEAELPEALKAVNNILM